MRLGVIHLLGYTTCMYEEDIISTYFLAGAANRMGDNVPTLTHVPPR